LIAAMPTLPRDPAFELRVADIFSEAQDYEHALTQYEEVLHLEHGNGVALAGAGKAAFQLGRYHTAVDYLRRALEAHPRDAQSSQLLEISTLVLRANPFASDLSDAEQIRRVRTAFNQAGQRLNTCAQTKGIDLSTRSLPAGLFSLNMQWQQMKPKLATVRPTSPTDTQQAAMDLVFAIEQQTAAICGQSGGMDEALLLLSRERTGASR
jgi:tetratricopeptide (TPR) repeat protein